MITMRSVAIAAMLSIAAVAAQADEAVRAGGVAQAEEVIHKLAIQVDENNPAIMNTALNNARNVKNYYAAKGEQVVIEIVAFGPGLSMFVDATSPVKDRISVMSLANPEITFSACENTLRGMVKKAGRDVPLIGEARMVPSGVVRLMELQAEGYAYLRP